VMEKRVHSGAPAFSFASCGKQMCYTSTNLQRFVTT
jgi:hypothetical protein